MQKEMKERMNKSHSKEIKTYNYLSFMLLKVHISIDEASKFSAFTCQKKSTLVCKQVETTFTSQNADIGCYIQ